MPQTAHLFVRNLSVVLLAATPLTLQAAAQASQTGQVQRIAAEDIPTTDYQNLSQVYEVAPQVIAGQHSMLIAQAGFGLPAQSQPNRANPNTPILAQPDSPIIEPIFEINWLWIGTSLAALTGGTVAYWLTRPQ